MIKFLARDDETGRIGTYQTTFVIPNLNKEVQRIPISSVILSSQRVDLKDALFDVMKGKDKEKEVAVNPLVTEGKKLVPSVTRVFSTTREMYVFLQAYKPTPVTTATPTTTPVTPPAPQPFFAFVTLYRNGAKAFESSPTAVTANAAARLGTTPLNFSLGMNGLEPGEYDCQVTILDPATQKANFWRAPVLLVP